MQPGTAAEIRQTGRSTSTEQTTNLIDSESHISAVHTPSPESHESALRGLLALGGSSETNPGASSSQDPHVMQGYVISTFDFASNNGSNTGLAGIDMHQRPGASRSDTGHQSLLSFRSIGQSEPDSSPQFCPIGPGGQRSFEGDESSASAQAVRTLDVSASSGTEVELLKLYRYNIAPWLDICDSSQPFGVTLLTKVQVTPGLRTCILGLAAACSNITWDMESIDTIPPISNAVNNEITDPIGDVVIGVMNVLRDILPNLSMFWSSDNGVEKRAHMLERLSLSLACSTLQDSAYWLLMRLGKICRSSHRSLLIAYISADLSRAFMASSSSHVLPASIMQPQETESRNSASQNTYEIIALCVDTVLSVQGDDDRRLQHRYGSSRMEVWIALVQRFAHWYKHRSQSFQPIIELYRKDGLTAEDDYPTILFTSGAALLANQLYHTGMLLLLQNKPRFGQRSSQNSPSMSTLWHAHRICGIAMQNDRAGWWDPCLVASVIIAGRTATHASQHNAILYTLESAQRLTGWNVAPYVEQMKTEWHLANGW